MNRLIGIGVALLLAAGCDEVGQLPKGRNATFSSDGRKLAFEARRDGKGCIGIFDFETRKTEWPEFGRYDVAQPAWSSSGELVYVHHDAAEETAYEGVMSNSRNGVGLRVFEDGKVRELTHGRWLDYAPSYSADGKRVYFTTTRGQWAKASGGQLGTSVWRCDAASGKAESVLENVGLSAGFAAPIESPCGRFLAWMQIDAFRDCWRVRVARLDDLKRSLVVNPPEMTAAMPTWSRDGRRLAFQGCGPKDAGWCVYVVDLKSGRQANLGLGENPEFAPDGKSVVCDVEGRLVRREIPPAGLFEKIELDEFAKGRAVFSVEDVAAGDSTVECVGCQRR